MQIAMYIAWLPSDALLFVIKQSAFDETRLMCIKHTAISASGDEHLWCIYPSAYEVHMSTYASVRCALDAHQSCIRFMSKLPAYAFFYTMNIWCTALGSACALHHRTYILCTCTLHTTHAHPSCIARCAFDVWAVDAKVFWHTLSTTFMHLWCTTGGSAYILHHQMCKWCTCMQTTLLYVHYMYLHNTCIWCKILLNTTMCFWCTSNPMHICHSSACVWCPTYLPIWSSTWCAYEVLQFEVLAYCIIRREYDARAQTMHFLAEAHNALLMRIARCTSNAHSTMHF